MKKIRLSRTDELSIRHLGVSPGLAESGGGCLTKVTFCGGRVGVSLEQVILFVRIYPAVGTYELDRRVELGDERLKER